jgi:hypothetical protein
MYERLRQLCTHKTNKKMRDAAFPAFDAFVSVVSKELMSGERSPEANRSTFAACPSLCLRCLCSLTSPCLVFHPQILLVARERRNAAEGGVDGYSRPWAIRWSHSVMCVALA